MSEAWRSLLTTLFTKECLLADYDGDGLPETVRARVILGGQAALPEQRAAVDLAARLGFETLAWQPPLVRWETPPGDEHIPVFLGRPHTLSPQCPQALADLLTELLPGVGLVALLREPSPALVVGGSDEP